MALLKRHAGTAGLITAVLGVCASDVTAQLTPELLARVEWIEETAISPDGRWVAYVRSLPTGPGDAGRGRARDLFLIAATGGEPRLLVSSKGKPSAPAWSPDGALLAFLSEFEHRDARQQIYAVPREGGEPRALTSAPTPVRGFAFSPDGRSVAYLAAERVPDSSADRERQGYDAVVYGKPGPHVRLFVKDLPEGLPRALTPPDRTVWDFVWSPNGQAFALQVTEGTDWISSRLQDVLAGVDQLIRKGLVDADRVAIHGHSYGGYLAALAAALYSDRFKAAIATAPITDWTSYIGSCREPLHETLALWNLWWYERPGLLSDRSPVAHVHKNWTPLLIDHGLQDEEVPFLQSVELYQALRLAGAEVQLIAYPREGHDYVEEAHRIDVIRRYLAWLDRHLAVNPGAGGGDGQKERRR